MANSGAGAQKGLLPPVNTKRTGPSRPPQLLALRTPGAGLGLSSSHGAHARCIAGVSGSAFQRAGLLLPVLCLPKGRVNLPLEVEGSRAGERCGEAAPGMLVCKRRLQSCRLPPWGGRRGAPCRCRLPKAVCQPFHPWELCWDPPIPSPLCKHTPTYSPLTHSPGFTMCHLF